MPYFVKTSYGKPEIQTVRQGYIEEIKVSGSGKADSIIKLKQGVNIIYGPSNTGKSYIINCIDYMFGAKDSLIDESFGYDTISLTVRTESGSVVMRRGLGKKKVVVDSDDPSVESGEYNIEYSKVGSVYNLGESKIEIIGPITETTNNLNNYSIVTKVSFGEMNIIMTGDAEKAVEKELVKSGINLEAEILKVGHHGSDTSSTSEFLDAVNPQYALISCGVGNIHEHPKEETMQKLEERNIEVYRTDESGTVVVTITATDISFSCEPGDYLSGVELVEREGK